MVVNQTPGFNIYIWLFGVDCRERNAPEMFNKYAAIDEHVKPDMQHTTNHVPHIWLPHAPNLYILYNNCSMYWSIVYDHAVDTRSNYPPALNNASWYCFLHSVSGHWNVWQRIPCQCEWLNDHEQQCQSSFMILWII